MSIGVSAKFYRLLICCIVECAIDIYKNAKPKLHRHNIFIDKGAKKELSIGVSAKFYRLLICCIVECAIDIYKKLRLICIDIIN